MDLDWSDADRAFQDEVRAFLSGPRPSASTHALGNIDIAIEGDRARSVINAVVHVLTAPGGTVLNRGLRYTDTWVRQGGRWLIAERIHKLRWHYDHPAKDAPGT